MEEIYIEEIAITEQYKVEYLESKKIEEFLKINNIEHGEYEICNLKKESTLNLNNTTPSELKNYILTYRFRKLYLFEINNKEGNKIVRGIAINILEIESIKESKHNIITFFFKDGKKLVFYRQKKRAKFIHRLLETENNTIEVNEIIEKFKGIRKLDEEKTEKFIEYREKELKVTNIIWSAIGIFIFSIIIIFSIDIGKENPIIGMTSTAFVIITICLYFSLIMANNKTIKKIKDATIYVGDAYVYDLEQFQTDELYDCNIRITNGENFINKTFSMLSSYLNNDKISGKIIISEDQSIVEFHTKEELEKLNKKGINL